MKKIRKNLIDKNNQIRFSVLVVLFFVMISIVSFVKPLPVKAVTMPAENWSVFADSDSLLSIPTAALTKPVKMITATLSSQSYLLSLNEKTGDYEAVIRTPKESGRYQLTTRIIYTDDTYEQSDRVVLVRPYGYLYAKEHKDWSWKNPLQIFEQEEYRVKDAQVSLYTLNDEGQWVLWQADLFKQKNPQSSGQNGEYVFVAPPGNYLLVAKSNGMVRYESGEFLVEEDSVINSPIQLRELFPWRILFVSLLIFVFVYFAGKKTLFNRR